MYHIGSDEEGSQMGAESPEVLLGREWEAVGPFPSGMREHPLMASPLAAFVPPHQDPDVDFAKKPYDADETWPSEFGSSGRVGWKRFTTGQDGWTEISYPDIRWEQARLDLGWSALQFQSVLRTTLTVPKISGQDETPILVDVIQGTEYAFIPNSGAPPPLPIKWYAGDVYAFAETSTGTSSRPSATSNFARCISLPPGEYVMLVRAMYEIRMFGDPGLGKIPTIRLKVHIEVDERKDLEVLEGLGIVPDIVDGVMMGEWVSVGVRGGEVVDILGSEATVGGKAVRCELAGPVKLYPGQIRPLAIRLYSVDRISTGETDLTVSFRCRIIGVEKTFTWSSDLRHISLQNNPPSFRITFPSPAVPESGHPAAISYAIIVPPVDHLHSIDAFPPVILATHGAGVDITDPFWANAMPYRQGGWAVLPTGKNEWGEDWHGASMEDAWAARETLPKLLHLLGIKVSEETLLIGHSNGGQGAWHLAARWPDRIVGVIAASGWLKIQDYVPYTGLVSHHYADPALMGILMSSLTPYNNDLHASNLAGIPVLAIHGAEDGNVPPKHSRAHVGIIASWEGEKNQVKMVEVQGEDHWWDEVFREPEVTRWIEDLGRKKKRTWEEEREEGFTLGIGNPQECRGRAGIRVLELNIPDLRGTNIKRVSVSAGTSEQDLVCDGGKFVSTSSVIPPRAYGPMIRLLASSEPISFIIGSNPLHLWIALRLAHDLYVYHRTDSQILSAEEALNSTPAGNFVVIGQPEENVMAGKMTRVPVRCPEDGIMQINGKTVADRGAGLITLHLHPTSPSSLACLIAGNDNEGLELAARLFPIRTGVPIPDWAIVGPRARWKGAGGFIGAGFWGSDWGWNEAMSWVDR